MLQAKRHWIMSVVQPLTIAFSLLLSWLLRFDFTLPHLTLLLFAGVVLVGVRAAAMYQFQLTHGFWRFTGVSDLKDLGNATLLGSLIFFVLIRIALGLRAFPYSIYVLEALLSFILLAGLRIGARTLMQRRISATLGEPVPVLIVGAGAAGMLLLQAMKQTSYRAVGFVDDDIAKQHIKFGGIPVVGRIDQLTALAKRYGAAEILIAVPSATGVQMIHITDACRQSGLPFRAVPSLSSLIVGKLNIAELHDVDLEDLLGRDPVLATPDMVNQRIEGRVVMVTGAAGSIGSELCRQLAGCNPRKLVCLDQAETPLFNLQQRGFPGSSVETVYAVGDITDSETMQQQILRHKVQVIFHAAAYKHVPMTEANPHEGLKNNVFGLLDLVEVAEECGCDDFVLVSSDKAVNPSSLMGCTKRLGEMIVGSRPSSRMRCISVRFGNVLGSQGSVVPVFQEQIRTTGVITVTHPEMTRYFMTIPEAASLVLQAFTVGEHGDILVLDMGKPVRIVDLARTLTRVLGKREDEVSIVFIGMRPGEKLFEELFYDSETIVPTALNKVMRAQTLLPCWNFLSAELLQLRAAAPRLGPDEVRAAIKHMIPEYEWQAPAGPVPVAAEAMGAAKFDPRNSAQVSVRPGKPSTALQHRTAAKRALNKKSYA